MPLNSPIQTESDPGFTGMASRLNPINLSPGMVQSSVNMRLDRGEATHRKGAKRMAAGISPGQVPLTLDFQLGTDLSITSLTRSGSTGTVTTSSAHGQSAGNIVSISGANQSEYNNDFAVLSVLSATSFTVTITGTPITPATGTLIVNVNGPIVRSVYTGGIFSAGIYSSPRLDDSNEYVVLCGPSSVYLWRYGSSIITKSLPVSPIAENILDGDVINVLQAFDKLYLMRWRDEVELKLVSLSNVVTGTYSQSGTTVTVTSAGHGLSTGDQTVMAFSTGTAVAGTYTITMVSSSVFTYTAGTTLTTSGNCTLSTKVATATTPTAHGYAVGEVARIFGAAQAGYNAEWLIATVPSTTTFTIACASTLILDSGVSFCRRVCAPLVWDGGSGNFVRVSLGVDPLGPTYSLMVSSPAVTYFNNQVALVKGRDQVLISDVLDAENYDPLLKSFRANTGSNDYLVGIHPYADGKLIVFGRKSIYLATIVIASDGISIDPLNSSLKLLTTEIGCSASKSIVTAGQYIYFLSDNGVYRLDNTQIDAALRGNSKPLSDPIADQLSQINQNAVTTSNAVCFNNRFWLAVPTVLSDGTPSPSPNTLLVYNMLNEAWESSDLYSFDLSALVVTDYGTQRRLFASSRTGLIYLIDEIENGADDQAGGLGSYYSPGVLLLRRYTFGTLVRKRLLRLISAVDLPVGAGCAFDAVTINPSDDFTISSLTSSKNLEENYTIKGPIRRRANLLDLRWRTTAGRPVLRAVTAEAAIDSLPTGGSRTEE